MNRHRGWTYWDNGPNYHPVTDRFHAESCGVEMGTSTEDGLLRMIDRRCEEYPPNGHGNYIQPYEHLVELGEYDIIRRRLNGKIYVQRWTEADAYQTSVMGYDSVADVLKALNQGTVEWSSVWTPA